MGMLCYRLQQQLCRGSSLAEAMQQETKFFTSLAISLTAAGEESGHLSDILKELAEYYSYQEKLKKFVVQALMYPSFLLLMSVSVLFLFILYILPVLGNVYLSMGIKPQGVLAKIIFLQDFLCNDTWQIVLGS